MGTLGTGRTRPGSAAEGPVWPGRGVPAVHMGTGRPGSVKPALGCRVTQVRVVANGLDGRQGKLLSTAIYFQTRLDEWNAIKALHVT